MAFNHKHLIDITEYSADDIMTILETAKNFKQVNERRIKKVPTLKGFTVVNMFNEPSTRTRSSFEIANGSDIPKSEMTWSRVWSSLK